MNVMKTASRNGRPKQNLRKYGHFSNFALPPTDDTMDKFRKIVAVEPLGLLPEAVAELRTFAGETVFYEDIPAGEDEMAERIADAVLLHEAEFERMGRKVLDNIGIFLSGNGTLA